MDRKVKAGGGIGIPLAVIVTWMWNTAMPEAQMPAEVSAALGSVISTVIAFFVRNPS